MDEWEYVLLVIRCQEFARDEADRDWLDWELEVALDRLKAAEMRNQDA